MKVFISWSGDRSKHIAETFEIWLRRVLQATEPWISSHIDKGLVWDNEISKNLNQSRVGILCLTSDNLESTYLHYEAGAISNVQGAIVCTFLFDIGSLDVKQPLSRFQNTKNDAEDILSLLRTINGKLRENDETHLLEKDLEENFKLFYPSLKEKLDKTPGTSLPKPKRTESELLEEILQGIRSIQTTKADNFDFDGRAKKYFSFKVADFNKNKLRKLIKLYKSINSIAILDFAIHSKQLLEFIRNEDPRLYVELSTPDFQKAVEELQP